MVRQSLRRVAVVSVVTVLSSVALVAESAGATFYAENGAQCTIVGTAGNDVLRGTTRHDVICGRGGDDVIYGGDGADTLDGGPGRDRLYGQGGNDTLLGGFGNDQLVAGLGDDLLRGSAGNDRLEGDAGNDIERGGTGGDTLLGGDGADQLHGDAGTDVVSGDGGNDTVDGEAGDDTLEGGVGSDIERAGVGNDMVLGDAGSDRLYGEDGNDILDGGDGVDLNDGGVDENFCAPDGIDLPLVSCKYDTSAPTAAAVVVTPLVDVTNASATLSISFHAFDDTGISLVQVAATSASYDRGFEMPAVGTERAGIWTGTVTISRYAEPGVGDVHIYLTDRVRRVGEVDLTGAFTILDRNPDTTRPQVLSLTTSTTTVDTRTGPVTVDVRARITDDLSGVDDVEFCPLQPMAEGYRGWLGCSWAGRAPISGTVRDGVWHATITFPGSSYSGVWNLAVWPADAAHPLSPLYWDGPDAYDEVCPDPATCSPEYRLLPNGAGRLTVLGVPDPDPPAVTAVRATPHSVDSVPGPTTVTFEVDAADPDGDGITEVDVMLGAVGDTTQGAARFTPVWSTRPVAGRSANGTWRLTMAVPQGMPPGDYALAVEVVDANHYKSFEAAAAAATPDEHNATLTASELGDWNGVITIVDHSATTPSP